MPHVVVKLWPGRSEEVKKQIAERISKDISEIINKSEDSVSVAIEEINKDDWAEKVYNVEIKPNMDKLYKKPGYTM
ncbi:MAG: tautomerase family protein [Candidatus Obscuribacterales bacterium]|nr:tautomerase family protein [Candidatus Obscuribacterales bacterium]